MSAGPRGPTAGPDLTAADPAAPVSDLHVGRLLFTPELLIRLARGRFEVIGDALPDDARWCSVAYDVERAAVSLVVEHPTFPASAPGDVIPILPAPVIRTLDSPAARIAPTDAMIDAAERMRDGSTGLVNHIGNLTGERPDPVDLPTAVEWLTELDRRADALVAAVVAFNSLPAAARDGPT